MWTTRIISATIMCIAICACLLTVNILHTKIVIEQRMDAIKALCDLCFYGERMQPKLTYPSLREKVASALYLKHYTRPPDEPNQYAAWRKKNSWESLDAQHQQIFLDIAQSAIGQILGPGMWDRVEQPDDGKQEFVRTDIGGSR